ncbi:MarR family transcriptional regulator [Streptomyces cylindrosporus]|uniref:MarR family transcriptional regulator n=1 Tax=Streptomyces cylindrosporus TaxID=2927583 RepID=A0ABS9Y6E6_9ACTN|nr:MarR family transcriptional regulator [Streptomyces cylindrosporus]MCI3272802.1 MarR family transcriptional regulator [Streptomyces cylindrosporus]
MSGYELLARSLDSCGREGLTGELRVSGSPGGTFHFRGGLVVAVESPGAPGAEALLLRSGRVTGEQWAALVRESGGTRWPVAGLIAHGYAGAAQLRVVCVMALQDAAFAILAGRVDGCEPGAARFEPPAPVPVGEPPARLLEDAARKLAALAALPHPVHPDRERPLPVRYFADGEHGELGELRRELLAHADGRRSARDLAFRTGRGVYTVTVEVGRMLAEGLLECAPPPAPVPVRMPPEGIRHRTPPPPAPPPPEPPEPADLPRRRPGGFFRLRNGTPR